MKKIISVFIAIVMLLGLCACGDTPDEKVIELDIVDLPELAAQKAVITYKVNGETVNEYETEPCPVGNLDAITEIGMLDSDRFCFVAGGTVYCLSLASGEELWENDEFGGGSPSWAVGSDGKLYICGYFGPELMIIGKDGTTLAHYGTVDKQYGPWPDEVWWPCNLKLTDNGHVLITFESNMMTFEVDPATGTVVDAYDRTVMINPNNLPGEYVDSVGDPTFELTIDDEWGYTLKRNGDTGIVFEYSGYLELDSWDEYHSEGIDWIRTSLNYSNDLNFEGWSSIGDYIVTDVIEQDGYKYIQLLQVNNGDSVMSIYYDNMSPVLYKIK